MAEPEHIGEILKRVFEDLREKYDRAGASGPLSGFLDKLDPPPSVEVEDDRRINPGRLHSDSPEVIEQRNNGELAINPETLGMDVTDGKL